MLRHVCLLLVSVELFTRSDRGARRSRSVFYEFDARSLLFGAFFLVVPFTRAHSSLYQAEVVLPKGSRRLTPEGIARLLTGVA